MKKIMNFILPITTAVATVGITTPLLVGCGKNAGETEYKIDSCNFTSPIYGTARVTHNVVGEPIEVTCTLNDVAYKIAQNGTEMVITFSDGEIKTIQVQKIENNKCFFSTDSIGKKAYTRIEIKIAGDKKALSVVIPEVLYGTVNTIGDVNNSVPTANFEGADVTENVQFSLLSAPEGVTINKNNNKIHIAYVVGGEYKFNIQASYRPVGSEPIIGTSEITLDVVGITVKSSGESTNFGGIVGRPGESGVTFSAKSLIKDTDITEFVKWDFVWENTASKSWLILDDTDPKNPTIKWTDDCEAGNFNFRVSGTYTDEEKWGSTSATTSDMFTLTIADKPTFTIDESEVHQRLNASATFILNCSDTSYEHSLKQIKLLNEDGYEIATAPNIETKIINQPIEFTLDELIQAAQENLSISFICDKDTNPTIIDGLTIQPLPKELTVDVASTPIYGETGYEGTDTNPIVVKLGEDDVTSSVINFEVTPVGEITGTISVGSDFMIKWTPFTKSGEVSFTIKASYQLGKQILYGTSKTIKLILQDNLKIRKEGIRNYVGRGGEPGKFDDHPVEVLYNGNNNVFSASEVKFETFDPAPVPTWLYFTDIGGKKGYIAWTADCEGNVVFHITAKYTNDSGKTFNADTGVDDLFFLSFM